MSACQLFRNITKSCTNKTLSESIIDLSSERKHPELGGTKMTSCASRLWQWVVVVMIMLVNKGDSKCAYEAIFNFGDSNSDTGGFWAAFPAQTAPNGMTFFKQPAGRATDGRLAIDFLGNVQYILIRIRLKLRSTFFFFIFPLK